MWRITAHSRASFAAWLLNKSEVWSASAALARWFRFQPSEIDRLDVEDMAEWLQHAIGQMKAAGVS